MILVDWSVWVDYFRGAATRQVDVLDALLDDQPLAVGDLILAEVLQGFDSDRDLNRARSLLTSLAVVELGGRDIAVQSARNFRALRGLRITVRKSIDAIIATRCIANGFRLLYSDREFDPFERHLGLRSAIA